MATVTVGASYKPPNLLGGSLCLDFVNTVDPRFGPQRYEYLAGYADLLHWARYVKVLDDRQVTTLASVMSADPSGAERAHARALRLREALHDLFTAVIASGEWSADQFAPLNAWLERVMPKRRISPDGQAVRWIWAEGQDELDRPLWPVVLSAAELLTTAQLARLRLCPGDDGLCGWFFLDGSKAGTRQWCSMRGCGNRAKARRHQARRKSPA